MQYLGRTEVVEKGWRKSWLWLIVLAIVRNGFLIGMGHNEFHVLHGIPTVLYRGSRLFFGAPLVTSQVHKLSHVTSHRREC